MEYVHPESTEVCNRNARIGIGITGVCESMDKVRDWVDPAYNSLRWFDKIWSRERGWPESIKLTTLKPSGTLSLLAGVTPGAHPAYAPYYIRRVRMSSNDPLVEYCSNAGYHVEYARRFDGGLDYLTSVVSFPCKSSPTATLARDMSAVEHLELVKLLQTKWSDSSVSVTIYYRLHELEDIKEWLRVNYETSLKTVSFMLHSDHGFDQPPYEEIDEDTYVRMTANTRHVEHAHASGLLSDLECEGGACPVR